MQSWLKLWQLLHLFTKELLPLSIVAGSVGIALVFEDVPELQELKYNSMPARIVFESVRNRFSII